MPAIKTESYDQDLKVLLVAQDSTLSQLVSDFFYQQQIAIRRSPLLEDDSHNFVRTQLDQNQFYKIVVILNFSQPFDPNNSQNQKLLDLLLKNNTPKIFVVRLSSKIDSTIDLCDDWKNQTFLEDSLINHIYQNGENCKILMGLDIIDSNSPLLQPYRSILQATANGFLLDPQCEIYPCSVKDFFESIKRELMRPFSSHYYIRGQGITTEELCLKLKLFFQSFFNKSLQCLDVDTTSIVRLEKKEDIVEVVIGCEKDNLVQEISQAADLQLMKVDPTKLSTLAGNHRHLSTQLSKPFKQRGDDFEFEITKKTDFIKENTTKIIGSNQHVSKSAEHTATTSGDSQINDVSLKKEKNEESVKNKDKPKLNVSTEFNQEVTQSANISFDDRVGKLFLSERTNLKTKRRSTKANIITRIKRKSKNKQFVFFAGLALLFLGLMFGLGVMFLSIGYHKAEKTLISNISAYRTGDISSFQKPIGLSWGAKILDKILDLKLIDNSFVVEEIGERLNNSILLLNKLEEDSRLIYGHLFGIDFSENLNSSDSNKPLESHPIGQLIKNYQGSLENALSELLELQMELESQNAAHFSSELGNQMSILSDEIKSSTNKLRSLGQLSPILPDLLAVGEKKNYYVLLQDNQELRPTGGFLQAVAAVTIEDGRITDHQVYTVNAIDLRVLGNLNASPEIETFLGESQIGRASCRERV